MPPRHIRRWPLVLACNLILLTALLYLPYRRWLRQYPAKPPWSLTEKAAAVGIPLSLLQSIGDFRSDARRNLRPPAPGVFRIGAIGDSFTWGEEVVAGYDYPSLLQRLFRDEGFANVEVLNLGSS